MAGQVVGFAVARRVRDGTRCLPPLALVRRVDGRLMSRAARARSPRLDRPLVALSSAADHSCLWFAVALGLALIGGPRGRRAARGGVGAIALASAITNGPVKLLVPRRRPPSRSLRALVRTPSSSSFPSGHSASAFAFATAVSGELPVVAPVLVPLAGMVAYSRVHTGVHYPTDVAAGAAIGVACGTVIRRLRRSASAPR